MVFAISTVWFRGLPRSVVAVRIESSSSSSLSHRERKGGRFPRNPREIIVGSWTTAAYLPFSMTVLSPRSMCILNFHIDIRSSFAMHFSSDLKLLWPRFYEISSLTTWKFHCFNFNSFWELANYVLGGNDSMKIKFIDFDIL